MRVVQSDLQLQGPRRQRDAVPAAGAGDRSCAGGQFRQWRRGGIGLCGGGRDGGDHHDARLHQPGENRADARARRDGRADPWHPPGYRGCCGQSVGSIFYASHNWHPFFLHGTKTLAYELWEDLGFRAPDNVITPCGAGRTCWAAKSAFRSCFARARSRRCRAFLPPSRPIVRRLPPPSWSVRTNRCRRHPPTMAEGTAIARPIRMREVLGALRETGGGAVTLTEQEIGTATLDLARIGIYVEPTCAQAAAALRSCWRPEPLRRTDHCSGDDGDRAEGHAADRGTTGYRPYGTRRTGAWGGPSRSDTAVPSSSRSQNSKEER